MRFVVGAALVLGIVAWSGGAATAAQIPIANAGFEAVALADGASSTTIPFWAELGPSDTVNPSTADFPGEAPEGQNVAALRTAVLDQTVGLVQFGTYTLEAKLGDPLGQTFAGYSIDLMGAAGAIFLFASSSSAPTPGDGEFVTATKTYDVLPSNANKFLVGTALAIQILAAGPDGLTAVDDVRLDFRPLAAVPEPPTLALTALGLLSLVLRRRARRPGVS